MAVIRARPGPDRREAMSVQSNCSSEELEGATWTSLMGLLPSVVGRFLGCSADAHCTSGVGVCSEGLTERPGDSARLPALDVDLVEEQVRAWCAARSGSTASISRLGYGRYVIDGQCVDLDLQVLGQGAELVALVGGGVPLPFDRFMAQPPGNRGAEKPAELSLDKLCVFEQLGSGGYGTVHRGTYDGMPVAVKQLHSAPGPAAQTGDEAFLREVAALQRCQHPALVRLVGYSRSPAYMVCELIKGPTLRARIDQARAVRGRRDWGPDEQRRLSLDMAEGLAYLHGLRPIVLHRDVKPANVLLSSGR